MKQIILFLFLILSNIFSVAQGNIFSKAYGDSTKPAMIFLHGGPGYNSFSFEYSTAQQLADKGFYVIVFDQRGCGRSETDSSSKFTFEEAYADLNGIYSKYHLTKATLIGHSFGGTLGILFSKNFPDKVENLILVGSPLSYQATFKGIIAKCRKLYESSPAQLEYLDKLEQMDSTSLEYSSYCFMHAMMNGFYNVKKPSKQAITIKENLSKSPDAKLISKMTTEPVSGFYTNEKYTSLHLKADLEVVKKSVKVFGIYGVEDGLFDEKQLIALENCIEPRNFKRVSGASHNVFLDQQKIFIDLVKKYTAVKK